jgi:hypothetical protein
MPTAIRIAVLGLHFTFYFQHTPLDCLTLRLVHLRWMYLLINTTPVSLISFSGSQSLANKKYCNAYCAVAVAVAPLIIFKASHFRRAQHACCSTLD